MYIQSGIKPPAFVCVFISIIGAVQTLSVSSTVHTQCCYGSFKQLHIVAASSKHVDVWVC